MGGSTDVYDTTPKETQRLRGGVVDWLMGQQSSQVPRPNFSALPPSIRGDFEQQWDAAHPPGSPYDRIFSQVPKAPDRTVLPIQGDVGAQDRSGIRDVNAPLATFDPSSIDRLNPNQFAIDPRSIPQIQTPAGGYGQVPQMNRGMVRDVNAPGTQSVDQLGGANSAFFQNMMAQLQPSFNNQRQLAVAGAKEAAGNLTGSGYASAVGNVLNRSLGDEQARLADYAARGVDTEVGRQQGDANRGLAAGQSNQGADVSFLDNILRGAGLGLQGQQLGLQGQQLGVQAGGMNQDAMLRTMLANQGIGSQAALANQGASLDTARLGQSAQGMNIDAILRSQMANQGADQFSQGQDQARQFGNQSARIGQYGQQGSMDANRLAQIYQMLGQTGQGNASNFLQMLLGQSTAGVSPNTVVRTPGIGEQLLNVAGQVGSAYAGAHGGH